MQKSHPAAGSSVIPWTASDPTTAPPHRKPAGPSVTSTSAPRTRRAGQQARPVRVMSWNAGHLGQQQWAEIKTWLQLEADKVCDVLILQEAHWQESAEFTVSGWYRVSSASKRTASQRKPPKETKNSAGAPDRSMAPSVTVSWFFSRLRSRRNKFVGKSGLLVGFGGSSFHGRFLHNFFGRLSACLVFQQYAAGQ